MPAPLPTHIECINPILRVEDMTASLHYYVDILGFTESTWGDSDFTCVELGGKGIYLCRGGQGHTGTWVWVGVGDVRVLHQGTPAISSDDPIIVTAYGRDYSLDNRVRLMDNPCTG